MGSSVGNSDGFNVGPNVGTVVGEYSFEKHSRSAKSVQENVKI